MKKAIILLLFVLAACQTGSQDIQQIPSPGYAGCSEYSGGQWARCINVLLLTWEDRENAPVKIEIVDIKRASMCSKEARVHYRFSVHDFSREWIITEDRPDLCYRVAEYGLIFLVGFAAGGAVNAGGGQ